MRRNNEELYEVYLEVKIDVVVTAIRLQRLRHLGRKNSSKGAIIKKKKRRPRRR